MAFEAGDLVLELLDFASQLLDDLQEEQDQRRLLGFRDRRDQCGHDPLTYAAGELLATS